MTKQRRLAAGALARLGPTAKDAVPALAEALAEKKGAVREQGRFSPRQIGPDAKAAVPALAGALRDSDDKVRRPAAEALAKIGAPAVRRSSMVSVRKGCSCNTTCVIAW